MVAVGEARVSPGAETGARSTLIGGLAPGDYVVYAFPEPVTVEYANPEALRDFESFAQKVTLTEGQRSQVTAPLALNQ